MKKLEYIGIFTAGYYNDMEAGHPVFIDNTSLSDIAKELLRKNNLDSEFCYGYDPFGNEEDVKNPLIGKKVKLTIEICDD